MARSTTWCLFIPPCTPVQAAGLGVWVRLCPCGWGPNTADNFPQARPVGWTEPRASRPVVLKNTRTRLLNGWGSDALHSCWEGAGHLSGSLLLHGLPQDVEKGDLPQPV